MVGSRYRVSWYFAFFHSLVPFQPRKISWSVWKPFVLSLSKHERFPTPTLRQAQGERDLECSTDFSRFKGFWRGGGMNLKHNADGFLVGMLIGVWNNNLRIYHV